MIVLSACGAGAPASPQPDPAAASASDCPAETSPQRDKLHVPARDGWRLVGTFPEGEINDIAATRDGTLWAIGSREARRAEAPEAGRSECSRQGVVLKYSAKDADRPEAEIAGPGCAEDLAHGAVAASGELWVAGSAPSESKTAACVARWTGRDWREYPLEFQPEDLAVTGDEAWVVRPADSPPIVTQVTPAGSRAHRLKMTPMAVAALSPTSVWVAGVHPRADKIMISHWDGRAWQAVPSPAPDIRAGVRPDEFESLGVSDLLVLGPRDIWLDVTAGVHPLDSDGDNDLTFTKELLAHWDGSSWSWSWQPGRRRLSTMPELGSDGRGGVWLSGLGIYDGPDEIAHVSGGRWTPITLPGDLAGGDVVTMRPGTSRAWVAGYLAVDRDVDNMEGNQISALWTTDGTVSP
ncbi:hypothetical protein GCM10009850_022440 [Nonomuraea monospora]|uniref:Uncharacterized protein n=2 Tax=Nonomuraea monospora TaxID=568818 RepID=A0ABN3CC39_9ACTN